MPTYEYECGKCGHRFEAFQSMKDEPLRRCRQPKCRGSLKRLFGTGAGIIFKGSGFYETDYRRKPGAGKESAPAAAAEPAQKSDAAASAPKSAAADKK